MVEYDPRTALVVVDVQNDFADPNGSLYVKEGEAVVAAANDEIARALRRGALVAYTQDWHPASTPHFQKDGGIWPVHCVQDTWGSDFHPGLKVADGEHICKGSGGEDGYSAFSVRDPTSGETSSTRLERILRERGIEHVVVCGLATDYCVVETVVDARRLGFEATVLTGAIRAVDFRPGDGDRALERMRAVGAEEA